MPNVKDYVNEAKNKGYTEEEIKDIFSKRGYSVKEISDALEERQARTKTGEDISESEKLKLLLIKPSEFFGNVRDDSVLKSSIIFLVSNFVIFALGLFFIMGRYGSYNYNYLGGYSIYFAYFIVIMYSIVLIYASIVHWIATLNGGIGNYKDTYNALLYSFIPTQIFIVILIIILNTTGFWMSYLLILASLIYVPIIYSTGISEYHKISKGKTAVAILIPLLIIGFLLYFFFLSSIFHYLL